MDRLNHRTGREGRGPFAIALRRHPVERGCMFPIGSTLPHDIATLHAGLAYGLAPLGLGGDAVTIEGEFPQLAAIRMDLTNAQFHRGLELAGGTGGGQSLCFARTVEIQGSPTLVQNVPVNLSLLAQDV